MNDNLEVVNIVGSGELDVEIDLSGLADDLPLEIVYIKGPGLYFKFKDEGPTVIVARTGKYIISGATSNDELQKTRSKVFNLLERMCVINNQEDLHFSIKNMVYTCDLENNIDLSTLAIHTGLENVEYEPEQFPGLIFRPSSVDSVALVFATGKVVITGVTNESSAADTVELVITLLEGVEDVK
jgi:transcription initiation factor TFIID TATA-box-binding protein